MPSVSKPSPPAASLILDAITGRFPPHPAFGELVRLRQDQPDAATRLRLVLSVYPELVERVVSAGYGTSVQPEDLNATLAAGIDLLGFRAIHATALLTCVVHAFDGVTHHLDAVAYWRRAALAAAAGGAIGAISGGGLDEEAAIGGLFIHLGWLALDQSGPEYLGRLQEICGEAPPTEVDELQALGFTVRDLTSAMARAWGLPEAIGRAAVDASAGLEHSQLARVLLRGLAAADAILAGEDPEPTVSRSIQARVGSTQALLTRVDALLSGVMLQ